MNRGQRYLSQNQGYHDKYNVNDISTNINKHKNSSFNQYPNNKHHHTFYSQLQIDDKQNTSLRMNYSSTNNNNSKYNTRQQGYLYKSNHNTNNNYHFNHHQNEAQYNKNYQSQKNINMPKRIPNNNQNSPLHYKHQPIQQKHNNNKQLQPFYSNHNLFRNTHQKTLNQNQREHSFQYSPFVNKNNQSLNSSISSPINHKHHINTISNLKNININLPSQTNLSNCNNNNKPTYQLNSNYDMIKLKNQLNIQKQKMKQLQEKTINDQMHVLQQLAYLDSKFQNMKNQKEKLQKQLQIIQKSQIYHQNKHQDINYWKQKYNFLQNQHKKVKGIQKALIDMMIKVQGLEYNQQKQTCKSQPSLHDAWKWVKGVVWQYQAIKKKALQWKKVYDKVKYRQQGQQQ